jgi:hypothetical protein
VYIGIEYPEALDRTRKPPHLGIVLAGLGIIFGCFVEIVALVLGIIGVGQQRTRKEFSVLGIVVSGLFIVCAIILVVGVKIFR